MCQNISILMNVLTPSMSALSVRWALWTPLDALATLTLVVLMNLCGAFSWQFRSDIHSGLHFSSTAYVSLTALETPCRAYILYRFLTASETRGFQGLAHRCARLAHCVTARWRNVSHYCRPLRQYDVLLRVLRTAKHWQPRRQHTVYTNKRLECKVKYCPCLTSWPEDSLAYLLAVIGPPR